MKQLLCKLFKHKDVEIDRYDYTMGLDIVIYKCNRCESITTKVETHKHINKL